MGGKVVLIEGLDLAGKSTLVRNLQGELTRRGVPLRVSRNALCPENPIATVADALRKDPHAELAETGALFLASHLWDARNFHRPAPGVLHLQDSCWLRTLAFHTARGTPDIPRLLRAAITKFPSFDVAVFLTASIEERTRRLAQREREQPGSNDDGDRAVCLDPDKFIRMEAILRCQAEELAGAVVIDTTGLRPLDLVESVAGVICRAGAAGDGREATEGWRGP